MPERSKTSPFGVWLRQQCRARGWTAKYLAQQWGMSPSYLSRMLSGKEHPPTPARLYDLAEILQIDPDVVFVAANKLPPDVDVGQALALYRQHVPQGATWTQAQAWEQAAQAQGFASAAQMFERMRQAVSRS